jgi:hypothetical protein
MKSAHRHELETNVLAHRLESYVERCRPYFSKVVFVGLACIALLFIWSYVSGLSADRRNEGWDAYNQAIGSVPPNLDQLHQTAEENSGTRMQRMADVTWADGQVFLASRNYISNRAAANDSLNKAASAYQGVIQSSDNEQLIGHARLGLARVFEMQNELEKARTQYEQVTGPFAEYAKAQAARLAKPEAKETYAWLATAQAPISRPPMGPGTPGQPPEFAPGDIPLPNGTDANAGKTDESKGAAETFENLLKEMQKDTKSNESGDRYKTDQPPATGAKPETPGGAAAPGEPKAGEPKSGEPPANDDAAKTNPPPGAPADDKAPK